MILTKKLIKGFIFCFIFLKITKQIEDNTLNHYIRNSYILIITLKTYFIHVLFIHKNVKKNRTCPFD